MSILIRSLRRSLRAILDDPNSGGLPKKRTKAPDGASASSTTVGSGSGKEEAPKEPFEAFFPLFFHLSKAFTHLNALKVT